jgi:hypothetical protein
VLHQPWLQQPRYAERLFEDGRLAQLGAQKATRLLGALLPDPVLDAVQANLPQLPDPHALDLAELAHRQLPPERLAAVRQPYLHRAEAQPHHRGHDTESGGQRSSRCSAWPWPSLPTPSPI